jgi:hypothetical protein
VTTYADQQAAARRLGGELGMTQWLSSKRRQAEQEQAQAAAAFAHTPDGELLAAEEELAIAGVLATQGEWEAAQGDLGNLPIPPKPTEAQMPPHLQRRIRAERLGKFLTERTTS